jgi:hypothetical protein
VGGVKARSDNEATNESLYLARLIAQLNQSGTRRLSSSTWTFWEKSLNDLPQIDHGFASELAWPTTHRNKPRCLLKIGDRGQHSGVAWIAEHWQALERTQTSGIPLISVNSLNPRTSLGYLPDELSLVCRTARGCNHDWILKFHAK